jgi:hypothetical protein
VADGCSPTVREVRRVDGAAAVTSRDQDRHRCASRGCTRVRLCDACLIARLVDAVGPGKAAELLTAIRRISILTRTQERRIHQLRLRMAPNDQCEPLLSTLDRHSARGIAAAQPTTADQPRGRLVAGER